MDYIYKKLIYKKMGRFSDIEKNCECCGDRLAIKSVRDITRKRFCSPFCRNSQTQKIKWMDLDYREKMVSVQSLPNPKKGRPGVKRVQIVEKCLNCNNHIVKTNAEIRTGHKKYCSKKCKADYFTGVKYVDIDKFKIYRRRVDKLTRDIKSILIEKWDGIDYYDGEYILDNFNLKYTHGDYPTVDHKVSVYHGFKNNLPPEEIARFENLCFTKRRINSTKYNKPVYEN